MMDGKLGDVAIQEALKFLQATFGIPPERVVLAFIDPTEHADGSTSYWTHVGRNEDRTESTLLEMVVVRDLQREAHDQMMAVHRGKPCPACGSPRYAAKQDGKDFPTVHFYDQCMDCGHRSEDR